MQIKIKLFATLRDNRGKIVYLDFFEPMTPRFIIDTLGIAEEDVAILLINGRDGLMDQVLVEEDYLSIFPPVGGG